MVLPGGDFQSRNERATVGLGAMPVLKRRPRLVTFRVSEDEYQVLSKCCIHSGARSVAEFARLSVLQNATTAVIGPGTLSGDLASVSRALSELDQSLGDARKRIRNVLGHVDNGDAAKNDW